VEAGRLTLTDGVVVLDRLRATDLDAHLAGEDEEQARRFGWWPRRSSPEHVRAMLAADDHEWCTAGSRRRFATRVGGDLVGGCELRLQASGCGEASYWTFAPFRGRGYATRATRLLAAWAFDELGVERVELHVEPDNLASCRVAEGASFRTTGRRTADGLLVYERQADG
jgi:RimJ/RimL family protein N-acetyltransferase